MKRYLTIIALLASALLTSSCGESPDDVVGVATYSFSIPVTRAEVEKAQKDFEKK